ncbi:MAG: tetratricopeptide repeat protein [Sciscionella sp.]
MTAAYSPTPLWGRRAVRDRLVAWCADRDPAAGVVRVVTGPAGVGKSRLALAVAEALPAGWVSGRLLCVDGLVERIAACGEPALVIVDDADRVSSLDVLIAQAARHPDLLRLLLLTRQAESLRSLPDTVLPQVTVAETLVPIGESADRQRWFAEATRCYARALRVPPPDLPARPVGMEEDTLLLLHARALLAVLGRTGTPGWSLREIAGELVVLEQRNWNTDLAGLPAGCDTDVLAEAVTILLLSPAETVTQAAELLRRVPQFAHDSAHESRLTVARWAHRHYPPGPDHRLDLRPHLVGERLLLDTLIRVPELLCDDAAVPVLTRAYDTFPEAVDLLTTLLNQQPQLLPARLPMILATGVTGYRLDCALATLLDPEYSDTRANLAALTIPDTFPHLRCAINHLAVIHYRELAEVEPDRHRPDLAAALNSLGVSLWELGRYREALTVSEEVVAVRRELAEVEPDRHRPDLAAALNNLGVSLEKMGEIQKSLQMRRESVAVWKACKDRDPELYGPPYRRAEARLRQLLDQYGQRDNAVLTGLTGEEKRTAAEE